MIRNYFILTFLFLSIAFSNAQNGLDFINKNDKSTTLRFKLINNLIVIPLEINGKELSFILDTGVNKTILFSLQEIDSLGLKNVTSVSLQGLGSGKPINALLSKGNDFKIKDIASQNEPIYVILKDEFNFSAKMGTTIHGIIGYAALKNFVVAINYIKKKITFYNPELYTYRKCRRCEEFPIQFYRKKPFIDLAVQLDTIGNTTTPVTMLIDSGGSDALWLFEDDSEQIITPKRYFTDVLGEGLSGTVYGKRSRIPAIRLGDFTLQNPTVSFLDSVVSPKLRSVNQRNGSIGANLLRRFHVWLDYPNQKIRLKKNSSFRDKFNYNMSGLGIIYNGQQLVQETYKVVGRDSYNNKVQGNNSISFVDKYKFIFKNSYVINRVLPGSPSDTAGLQVGDLLVKLNSKPAYQYKLSEIINLFQRRKNKKITLLIEREGKTMKFQFRLTPRI